MKKIFCGAIDIRWQKYIDYKVKIKIKSNNPQTTCFFYNYGKRMVSIESFMKIIHFAKK